jgi:hypothetical protein
MGVGRVGPLYYLNVINVDLSLYSFNYQLNVTDQPTVFSVSYVNHVKACAAGSFSRNRACAISTILAQVARWCHSWFVLGWHRVCVSLAPPPREPLYSGVLGGKGKARVCETPLPACRKCQTRARQQEVRLWEWKRTRRDVAALIPTPS